MAETNNVNSSSAIHVKGFPANTNDDDIMKALSKYGKILPSSKFRLDRGYAIIDFDSLDSVNKALSDSGNVVINGSNVTISSRNGVHRQRNQRSNDLKSKPNASGAKKVYVLPIPKETTQEEIKSFFSKFGEVTSASIRSRKDQKGFAFITFATEEAAAKAVAESEKLSFKGETVSLEFRKSGDRQKRNRKPRAAKVSAQAESNGDNVKVASAGRNNRRKNVKKNEAQSSAPTSQTEQTSSPTKNLHIRSIPFDTSADAITGAFARFGAILNTSVKVIPSAAFIDYESEEDRENVLKKAFETSKEEKTGSFGSAPIRVFRSRGKKGEKKFSLGVKGFKGSQIPTEDDLKKLFPDAPISKITIFPAHAFAFVDFDSESSLTNALAAKVTLPGMTEPLQVEVSKHGPRPKGNRRGGVRRFRRGPKATKNGEAQ